MRRLVLLAAVLLPLVGRAEPASIEIGYPGELEFEQGPGHFAFDFLRAAEMIVNDSGLKPRWSGLPLRRIVRALENQSNFCVGGAGILPERQAIGLFTRPFAYDQRLALIGLKDRGKLLNGITSFHDLAANANVTFLADEAMYYGPSFTPQLRALDKRVNYSPRSLAQMLGMLRARRADFAIMPKTYVLNRFAQVKYGADFVVRDYPDMHRDYRVAFLCNKRVPAPVIEALNAAIDRQLPAIRLKYPDLFEDAEVSGATR